MAVIGIDYSEGGKPLNYKGVYLHTSSGKLKFESGDFVKDWFQAKMKYAKELQDQDPFLSASSTCDHFIMDGANYDSAYLHIEDGKGILKYVDRSDPNYLFTQSDIYENGWEMFVNPGTQPTWEELKEMCK